MPESVSGHATDEPGRGGERRAFLRGGRARRLPVDDVFRLLANRERRVVLQYVREAEPGTASVEAALDAMTEVEREFDPAYSRERAEIALHHNHLPRLEELGVVDYDGRTGAIRYQGDDRVELALDLAIELSGVA